MKTLILTSDGMTGITIRQEIKRIIGSLVDKAVVAYITTASKPEKDTTYARVDRNRLIDAGFDVEDVDVEGKTEKGIMNILKGKNVIYVQGGNSFYLLKYVKESGFDKVVKKLIEEGAIYVGVSAGSYIACPTIEMAQWKHQDRNIVGLKDLRAINLVPFLITAHYEPKYNEVLKKEISNADYSTKILADDQALLVQDGKVTLIGKGEEIKI